MTDVEKLILDEVRGIREDVSEVKDDVSDVKERLARLEARSSSPSKSRAKDTGVTLSTGALGAVLAFVAQHFLSK